MIKPDSLGVPLITTLFNLIIGFTVLLALFYLSLSLH